MEEYTMYVCETCGYESKDYQEMYEHEAAHLGLTLQEAYHYSSLKYRVTHLTGVLACVRGTDEMRADLAKAIEDLAAFEKEHNINQ